MAIRIIHVACCGPVTGLLSRTSTGTRTVSSRRNYISIKCGDVYPKEYPNALTPNPQKKIPPGLVVVGLGVEP